MKVVSGRILEALAFRGYGMNDLATKLGISPRETRLLCYGQRELTPQQLMVIAQMTRFPVKWFTQTPKVEVIDEGTFYHSYF